MQAYHPSAAFITVAYNELRRTFRLAVQTVLPPAITTFLYFMIFGHLMGNRIGAMGNLPYIEFIVPGLIIMSVLTASFSASVSVVYSQKWTRVIDEMLISPMTSMNILCCYIGVGMLRGIVISIVVSIIALLCAHVTIVHPFYAIFIGLLSSAIFATLGVLNGLVAKNFDQVSIMPTFIITPLSYLGGVFYSLSILPPFWQKVALFNPLVYIISTFRYAFFGLSDTHIVLSTLALLLVFVLLLWLGYLLLRSRKGIVD